MTDPTPIFKTERLTLKPPIEADAPAYNKYLYDPEVMKHLTPHYLEISYPYPEENVLEYIKDSLIAEQGNDMWFWGIFLKNNPDELIGGIQLWRNKGTTDNRAFWLGKKFWGQGIMTEAIIPVNNYAFSNLGFEKLIFSCGNNDIAAKRVKEKTGGHLIEEKPTHADDHRNDKIEIWELTKTDWETLKK